MSTIYPKDPLNKILVCHREPECIHALLRSVWWSLLIVTPVSLASVSIFGWWCASVPTAGGGMPVSGAADTKIRADLKTVLSDMEARSEHYNKVLAEPLQVRDPAPVRVQAPTSGATPKKSGNGLIPPIQAM